VLGAIALLAAGVLVWVAVGSGPDQPLASVRTHATRASSARPVGAVDQQGPTYVALGDSYTSGPGLAEPEPGSSACGRSELNYPHLVAQELGLSLTDASCGGATVADVGHAQSTLGGVVPAQLSAVGPDTDVVTVSLGGDDIGFSSIIANCVALTPWGPTRVGLSCAAHYGSGADDQLARAVTKAGTALGGALQAIHVAAPHATILVVGYPQILSPSGACWPSMPFTSTDAAYLNGVEQHLNAALAEAAAENGAQFVDLWGPSSGHDACATAQDRWVEPLDGASGTPVHPNAAGQAAMAGVVAAAVRAAGID
jgi:lysophospholipase L1-like esterase